ncbi:LapD/MoxY N-terminal periplasmic domain-containing protein [Aliarcobacter butzleri]|uniref:LapD/MoxY N-terminal periplasmic domain-containing protein n=1 Tax=Aliarcobacter butzleri TaxID=28197 RepID=A0AAW6VFW2_9BACT|nr:LapD/MoxY N-terminal periplasmic domain-containing protein [Aliarcobacter butzleri]MDK2041399.1 LapD/MoxY N-terminal periplasmic domain-containing protein [Aliarcobacter butzleri]MDK2096477.1 LapD/MoxY N-terminal periplasmic domain-containing protein [Aliarcobacter butzleri]
MLKSKLLYIILSIFSLTFFVCDFWINFEKMKEDTVSSSLLKTKTTSIYLQENLKKFLEDKTNPEILSIINQTFNSDFKSIKVDNSTFEIKEEDLVKASNDLDKNQLWEVTNTTIDETLGRFVVITQSDDFEKELLTLNGSIPNEDNKSIVPSQDIYTFLPNKNFKNQNSLTIKFKATNQFEKVVDTQATIYFDKTLAQVSNNNVDYTTPLWFKEFVPIYLEEQANDISNSWKSNATIYVNTNVEKIYFELYEKVKEKFFDNLLWFFVTILGLFGFRFLYRVLVK